MTKVKVIKSTTMPIFNELKCPYTNLTEILTKLMYIENVLEIRPKEFVISSGLFSLVQTNGQAYSSISPPGTPLRAGPRHI